MTKSKPAAHRARSHASDGFDISPVFTWMDAPLHLMNLGLMSMHALQGSEALLVNEASDLLEANPSSPDPTGGLEAGAADAMVFWADQVAQANRLMSSVLDTNIKWWRDMEAGVAQMLVPPTSRELHITPDSAGAALCAPFDLSPRGIALAAATATNALSQAWMNAVEHELQLEELGAPAREQGALETPAKAQGRDKSPVMARR